MGASTPTVVVRDSELQFEQEAGQAENEIKVNSLSSL